MADMKKTAAGESQWERLQADVPQGEGRPLYLHGGVHFPGRAGRPVPDLPGKYDQPDRILPGHTGESLVRRQYPLVFDHARGNRAHVYALVERYQNREVGRPRIVCGERCAVLRLFLPWNVSVEPPHDAGGDAGA